MSIFEESPATTDQTETGLLLARGFLSQLVETGTRPRNASREVIDMMIAHALDESLVAEQLLPKSEPISIDFIWDERRPDISDDIEYARRWVDQPDFPLLVNFTIVKSILEKGKGFTVLPLQSPSGKLSHSIPSCDGPNRDTLLSLYDIFQVDLTNPTTSANNGIMLDETRVSFFGPGICFTEISQTFRNFDVIGDEVFSWQTPDFRVIAQSPEDSIAFQ
jgi:hypothetical protein